MRELTEAERRFLDNPFSGVVTTLRPDGSPHNTVVWVDHDGRLATFNTARGRTKPRHLERDPRVALTVIDPQDDHRWLSISGTAELVDEGAEEHINRLALKYTGRDSYRWRDRSEQRVTVRIHAEHVDGYGVEAPRRR